MKNKKPPFEITNTMIHQVAEIAELVGKLTSTNQLSANPTLSEKGKREGLHLTNAAPPASFLCTVRPAESFAAAKNEREPSAFHFSQLPG